MENLLYYRNSAVTHFELMIEQLNSMIMQGKYNGFGSKTCIIKLICIFSRTHYCLYI